MTTKDTLEDQRYQHPLEAQRHAVSVTVTGSRLAVALCSAFDGGSTYWAARVKVIEPPPNGANVSAYIVPFIGGTLAVELRGGATGLNPRPLNLTTIMDGVRIMAKEHPTHFANLVCGNADEVTGDVLLQLAVFGCLEF